MFPTTGVLVDMFPHTDDIHSGVSGHVEMVVKLYLKIGVTTEPWEESNNTPREKVTYPKIKKYVKENYGVNVHTRYIAEVKRKCGLEINHKGRSCALIT